MELPKVLPPSVPDARAGTSPAQNSVAEHGSASAQSTASTADRADIRPLDVPGALLILLAEVRSQLDSLLEQAMLPNRADDQNSRMTQTVGGGLGGAGALGFSPTESPVQAAISLVDLFLKAVPETAIDAPTWIAVLARIEADFQSSLGRAIDAVAAWRDVPSSVVDAAKDTRAMVFLALDDVTPNPLWLRPEWLGLAPRIQRFYRRRRKARRSLTDPDFAAGALDDEAEEYRQP